MARDISTINQVNLWGKSSDSGLGLEPQRTDLFMVDFNSASKGVAAASNQRLAEILPQFVRSVTIPELRTKAEAIRRDSVAYNMPSWDDPLDALKVTFLLDTHEQDDTSAVIQFLDAWLALTRAGRGSRFQGYTNTGWLTLNLDYRVDFTFNFSVYLLRGALLTGSAVSASNRADTQLDAFLVSANAMYRNAKKRQGLVQTGNPVPEASTDMTTLLAQLAQQQPNTAAADVLAQDMVIHSVYDAGNAWLAAYKISDLSYIESNLVTVEATFYAESFQLQNRPVITGSALVPAQG